MTRICLLGASGSIGKQTLEVMKEQGGFELVSFSVGHNVEAIEQIIKENSQVQSFYLIDNDAATALRLKYKKIKIFSGEAGLKEMVSQVSTDMVVNALVGFCGLVPSLISLERNLDLALANKESLVVCGELINNLLKDGHGRLYPIDSEHSAILKCLLVDSKSVKDLILTASGGAFRNLKRDELESLTKEDALKHPTWIMGQKITIDSATMMNKCFEIIEAHYLFNYPYSQIKVILHDESNVHSMVLYNDGTYRAEINKPDMKNPILFALNKNLSSFETFTASDYHQFGAYHFHEFDLSRFPLVRWAEKVIDEKGIFGAVINASNEIAVQAFLNNQIKFMKIEEIVDICMSETKNIISPTLEQIIDADKKTRIKASKLVEKWRKQ